MRKRTLTFLLAVVMTAVTILSPVSANAAGADMPFGFSMEGMETGEAVADSQYEQRDTASGAFGLSENGISDNTLAGTESVFSYSGSLALRKPSKAQIISGMIQIYSAEYDLLDAVPKTTAPYSLGAVSASHRQKALDSINWVRMIGGMPEVYMHDTYNTLTQYGAVVLAANDALTHTPGRPAGMDDAFYNNGYTATSHSNIAYGWRSSGYYDMPMFTLGYMDDSVGSNVPTVGHRRWILSPYMLYTGFGYAINGRNAAYSAMYAFNGEAAVPDYDFISWPSSGYFPSELGGTQMPWHVTLNPDKFDVAAMNTDNVQIVITAPDGRRQTIMSGDTLGSINDQSQPYYTINKQGYAVANAIIFRPGTGMFGSGELNGTYTVTITGLREKNGNPATVSYQIAFFEALQSANITDALVTGYIERLYRLCMDREADAGGLSYWKQALLSGQKSGAVVAQGFFFSSELKNRNLSDEQFVELLYEVMMDRSSDADGKTYWLKRLEAGVSREGVFKGFAESQEFENICSDYGIQRGTITVGEGRDRNTGVTMFVSRLYTKALGRGYDVSGLNDWCNRICDGTWSVTDVATTGFFNSREFLNKNLSNEEYVKVLYRTFLDREYDAAGLSDWVNKLNTGAMSRNQVLKGFSYSREFANIMREYGL